MSCTAPRSAQPLTAGMAIIGAGGVEREPNPHSGWHVRSVAVRIRRGSKAAPRCCAAHEVRSDGYSGNFATGALSEERGVSLFSELLAVDCLAAPAVELRGTKVGESAKSNI